MKTYVLTISKYFPAKHPKVGGVTKFFDKIYFHEKIHTIRANYELWKKRIDKVNEGSAVISVRQWTGKPYHSKQEEKFQFKQGEVGIQKIEFTPLGWFIDDYDSDVRTYDIAQNDGLLVADFIAWFKNYPDEPMAIIHFTSFRYTHN